MESIAPEITLAGLLFWAVHRINYYVDHEAFLKFENAIKYTQLMRQIRERNGQSSDFNSSAKASLETARRVATSQGSASRNDTEWSSTLRESASSNSSCDEYSTPSNL